jgi:hypothetical protein
MKARHATLGVTLLAAGWLSWFGDNTSGTTIVPPAQRNGSAGLPAKTVAAPVSAPAILELRARGELIGSASGAAETLFGSHSWTPPPPPPPMMVNAPPPPKPSAPPLPFIYLGKKLENGKWEAYLARGSDTYVVREKSMIDGTYRAESITPSTLTITYLPLQQVQTLTIGWAE